LLGVPVDSKEVAIITENFVIPGKAFFQRCLAEERGSRGN
jgi:hypothetical protein